ncbi:unnamed protein product, partial [Prorocentrum cordatum]
MESSTVTAKEALLDQLGGLGGKLKDAEGDVAEVFNPGEFMPVFDLRVFADFTTAPYAPRSMAGRSVFHGNPSGALSWRRVRALVEPVMEILNGISDELCVGQRLNEPSIGRGRGVYCDGVAGAKFDAGAARKGRREEMDCVEMLGVCERAPVSKLPLGGWVVVGLSDLGWPEIKRRLFANETKRLSKLGLGDAAAASAATPPLEARLRSAETGGALGRAAGGFEVRAWVALATQEGDVRNRGCQGRIRHGGGADHEGPRSAMRGELGTCVDREGSLYARRHGGDFVALGDRRGPAEFAGRLGEKLSVKARGALGPGPWRRGPSEIAVPNLIAG